MRTLILAMLILAGCPKVKGLEATVSDQEARIASLEADLATRDAGLDTLEAEVRALNYQIEALKTELAASEAALAEEQARSARILKDKGALATEITSMKAAMADLEARKRAAELRVSEYRDLVLRFQALIDAGTLQVKIVDGRMVLAMKTDILFASGSAKLSDDGKAALTEIGTVLAELIDRDFQVEGHTDDVPISSEKYPSNWYLAAGRAIGVVDHLITAGMATTQLSAASYGQERPVAANDTPEGKAANRRIEIVVVPDLSDLPGFDELTAISEGVP